MLENFGKYKIICELARGGMGVVYKAEDPELKRLVAVKELFLDHVDDEKKIEFRERFRREAILAANLRHPNIVAIYDVAINDQTAYYIMELLAGETLRHDLLRRPNKRMSTEEFFPIFSQTCKGLSHAKDNNLVHRDIKPDNIFILPDGSVKLTDFGIACSTESENNNLTKPGVLLGTLAYASPEQLQDAHNVDHRADLYSLAVVAYEALVGEVPFAGDGLSSTMISILTKEARPANEVNSDVSPDVAAVIAKAMRKKPEERYASVDQFEKEFERAMNMHRGSSSGSMLRARATTGSYTPGIPVPAAGHGLRTTAALPLPGAGSEEGKAKVKPWLAGRSAEKAKLTSGQVSPITKSVPLVKAVGKFGVAGDYPGAFLEPAAICARAGKIIVTDTGTRKFQIFSKEGKCEGESNCTPGRRMGSKTGGGVFSKPSGVTIDALGRIYAADAADHYVRIFDAQGSFLREFVNKNGKEGGIYGLIIEDATGNIYLSDPDNGCVHVVTCDMGAWMRKCGSKGSGDGQMLIPQGVALDQFGQLYVLDQATCKISVFSTDGVFQRSWGGKGKGKGEFTAARGIAFDQVDRVYVADSLNHRVQVFSAAGDYLYSFGGWGTELGRFSNPIDLSIDKESNLLYVVDKGNCRVQIFEVLES